MRQKFLNWLLTGTQLEYKNMPDEIKDVIGLASGARDRESGQLNLNPRGGVSGQLSYLHMPVQVQNVITAGPDTEGSYLVHECKCSCKKAKKVK